LFFKPREARIRKPPQAIRTPISDPAKRRISGLQRRPSTTIARRLDVTRRAT
jgi:hypothetical protein